MCGSDARSRYPDKALALESQPGLFCWKFEGGRLAGQIPPVGDVAYHLGQFDSAALLPRPTTEGKSGRMMPNALRKTSRRISASPIRFSTLLSVFLPCGSAPALLPALGTPEPHVRVG